MNKIDRLAIRHHDLQERENDLLDLRDQAGLTNDLHEELIEVQEELREIEAAVHPRYLWC